MQQQQKSDNSSLLCCCCNFLESDAYRTRYRSKVLLSLALITVSLSSGLIYGWPALRARLLVTGATSTPAFTEDQLGLMYTCGSWSTQGGRFFLGLARDRFGTKIIACVSLLILLAGLVGIGAISLDKSSQDSDNDNEVVLLAASLFAIGMGSGAQLCVQPVAGLFPNQTGIVLSSLSGAFQVSGLVFLALVAGDNSNGTLRLPFWCFGAVIVVLMVVSAILLPSGDSFLLPEQQHEAKKTSATKDDGCGNNEEEMKIFFDDVGDSENRSHIEIKDGDGGSDVGVRFLKTDLDENDRNVDLGEPGCGMELELVEQASNNNALPSPVAATTTRSNSNNTVAAAAAATSDNDSPPGAWQQIKTPEYVLLCLWFSIGIIPMQYYVGIIGYQLEGLGDDTGLYTDLFSYIFAGAAITAPLAGYIADKHGLGTAQGLATLVLAVPFWLLTFKESFGLGTQVVGLLAYGLGRMGVFGLYFTNCGKRFGYSNFGTLAGLGLLTSALLSLLQYPLIALTVRGYSKPVNLLLGVVLLLQAPYFVWLHKRERISGSALSPPRVEGQGDDGFAA